MSIETLSDVPLYAARASRQVPPKRKVTAWIVVGIVHLVLLNLFLFSQTRQLTIRRGEPHETMLDLRGMTRANQPSEQIVAPQVPTGVPPVVVTEPIIIPPTIVQQPPEPQGRGITDGDLLGAIGREVACSAGNYENLTMSQRSRCPRIPWAGARLPNGAIVLQAPPPRNRFFEEEQEKAEQQQAARVSGADAQLNKIEGARDKACPVIVNTPCFNRIPGRD